MDEWAAKWLLLTKDISVCFFIMFYLTQRDLSAANTKGSPYSSQAASFSFRL